MAFNFKIDNIKYFNIYYRNAEGNPVSVRAALQNIREGGEEIIACLKTDKRMYVNTPQEVTLNIICNDGLYRTVTQLKSVENALPYVYFILESPKDVEYQQNREYFRIRGDYKGIYTVKLPDGNHSYSIKTYDISASGVSIIIPELIVTKEDASLKIVIDGREVSMGLQYVRSEKFEQGYRLAFKYSEISEQDRDYISRVCIKRQIAERRSSMD